MKNRFWICFFLLLFFVIHLRAENYGNPDVDVVKLEKSFSDWWKYHNKTIRLSTDFIALDNVEKRISKQSFLEKLNSGEFIPVKLNCSDSICYQLYKLEKASDKTIPDVIKYAAAEALKNFKMEGNGFPSFSFKDLKGVEYNNAKLKGKILVVKCWFIACPPCIEEIPVLNELVEKYRIRKDVVFLGLAFDQKKALDVFLQKNPFKYAVIPNQKQFEFNTLDVKSYPTHIIVDQKGIIRKVVNSAEEMILTLDKIAKQGVYPSATQRN